MERNQALKSFESFAPKEYLEILKDNSSLEEKLMAIYLKALKPEVFKFYRPVKTPLCPSGWVEEYQVYVGCTPSDKSSVWREMLGRFGSYIKALDLARAENLSHKTFLKDMRDFFKDRNSPVQFAQVTQRLIEFESMGVA